jgi:hypothetical protein
MSTPIEIPAMSRPTLNSVANELMRGFCVDWIDSADQSVCDRIMAPGYVVDIGGIVLAGRDQYVPATAGQLALFPGLQITAHEIFTDGDRIALRFTEHGATADDPQKTAAWRGIALFWIENGVLARNVTEEDYYTRRAQLSGDAAVVDIQAPAVAPWSTQAAAPVPATEQTVTEWLTAGLSIGSPSRIVFDDGVSERAHIAQPSVEVIDIFSAGTHVAFRALSTGRYSGGLGLPAAAEGLPASLSMVGMVTVDDDTSITGHVITDRAGLRRSLSAELKARG